MGATYLLLALLAQTPPGAHQPDAPESELVIASETDCPSSEAVRLALAKLRPTDEWPEAVVAIRLTDQTLSIDIGATNPVQRRLAVGPDCAERASSAALVIATWMDDLPAEAAGTPLLRAAERPLPTTVDASARYELGAGLGAATGAGWTPAAHVELIGLREGRRLGWQASIGMVAPRDVSVGRGVSHWLRSYATVGVLARQSFTRLFLAADLGLAGAYTIAWGTGYDQNGSDGSFTWGPAAGARAGIPWGRFRLWTDLHLRWWLKGDTVQIDSASLVGQDSAQLPSKEVQWSLGLSYALP
jgi:hypothetical protein